MTDATMHAKLSFIGGFCEIPNFFLLEAVYVIAEPYFALSSHHFQEHYCDGVDSNVHNHRENHWSTDFFTSRNLVDYFEQYYLVLRKFTPTAN